MANRLFPNDYVMAGHFPSLSDRTHIDPNAHMFVEDVHLAVMPIGGASERHPGYRVNVEGGGEAVMAAKQVLSNFATYEPHSLELLLADAINEIAVSLAHVGRAFYEIAPHEDGEFSVRGFTSKRLIRLPFYYLQLIPKADWELWERKYSLLSASKVLKIEMPRELGGYGQYRKLLKRLRRFDHTAPDFWRQDLESGKQTEGFDFSAYSLTSDIYVNRVTRAWGWNRRDWTQKRSTEYFNFYKVVVHRRSQAIIRHHILHELNGLLRRLDIDAEIVVSGLPSESDISGVLRQLETGEIGFDSVSDAVTI